MLRVHVRCKILQGLDEPNESTFWWKAWALLCHQNVFLCALAVVALALASLVMVTEDLMMETERGTWIDLHGGCDIFTGRWLKDGSRPLYNGRRCSWLSPHWACRRSKRPSFEYEKYRWQPDGCDLPQFDGEDFLNRMRNKKILILGDSLGKQHYQSLLCLLSSTDRSSKHERAITNASSQFFVQLPGMQRPIRRAHTFVDTNTTVIFHRTPCLCEVDPYDPSNRTAGQAMHVDRPDPFLRQWLKEMDVVVLNTGHHWHRFKQNGEEFYVNGSKWVLVEEESLRIHRAQEILVDSLAKWIDEELKGRDWPLIFYTSLSPRHFVGGEWNSGGACDQLHDLLTDEDLKDKELRDPLAEDIVWSTVFQFLNITHLSSYRGESHPSKWTSSGITHRHDCLHWCLPGVPDVWNELMYAKLVLHEQSH